MTLSGEGSETVVRVELLWRSVMSASANKLSGSLPLTVSALTNLTALELDGNKFVGTVPKAWSKLARLR